MSAAFSLRHEAPGEVLVALPKIVPPVTQMRSITVCASLLGLAKAGLSARHQALLPDRSRAALSALTASEWMPIELAMDHYRACEALQLDAEQFDWMYKESSTRLRGTVLSTVLSLARAVGGTPLLPMGHYPRIWDRLYRGGAVGVVRPQGRANTAQMDIRGLPLVQIPYFARGFVRLHQNALEHFARSVRITAGQPHDVNSVLYNVTWS